MILLWFEIIVYASRIPPRPSEVRGSLICSGHHRVAKIEYLFLTKDRNLQASTSSPNRFFIKAFHGGQVPPWHAQLICKWNDVTSMAVTIRRMGAMRAMGLQTNQVFHKTKKILLLRPRGHTYIFPIFMRSFWLLEILGDASQTSFDGPKTPQGEVGGLTGLL